MKRIPRLLAVSVVAAAVACSDSFQPTVANVSGIYDAQTFSVTDSGGVTANPAGSLSLALVPDGRVTGELSVPADSGVILAQMEGTWSLSGDVVEFHQTADTFVRDMPWIATDGRLTADQTLADRSRVRIVLIRHQI